MNILSRIKQVIRFTTQHVIRNFWQSLAVVIVLMVTYYIGLFIGVTGIASGKIINYFEQQPQITVFFKDEAQEEQILQVKRELEKTYPIKEITYISKEQAVEIYKSQHQDDPELLEFVTPDILPASLEISVQDISVLSTIAAQFNNNQLVERVIYQEDLISELTHWTNTLRQVGMYSLVVLGFVAVIIITLTIGNNIQQFGKEIEIMRLVGAEAWFIRIPFAFDGLLLSVIALIIASVAMYVSLPTVEEFVHEFLVGIPLITDKIQTVTHLAVIVGGIGTVVTMLVSYLVMFKYARK